MKLPRLIEPPPSTSFVVIDAQGRELASLDSLEDAMHRAAVCRGAVAVLGAPSGVVLARITHGPIASEAPVNRAGQRWRERRKQAARR